MFNTHLKHQSITLAMIPRTILFVIFMAFIPEYILGDVGCMGIVEGKLCGRDAHQIPLPGADQFGDCGDPRTGCKIQRTKYYYKCGGCQSITVKNYKARGKYEGCGHENKKLYIQGTLGNHEYAPESVPPSQGTSESAYYQEATPSTTRDDIQYFEFFR
ncbi:hypothetical protein PGT21_014278 [Puccinia graminis f. sp. tritici]|uniref:Uncharacterized protein n=1 Tax=Puccinia graminis f. sp. tritici TaxID=56615 RepID=A0A5B0PER0_PUCGR|nr:hypothetical protein PGTUg99_020400 [Puccinia graminis f. sp. tritici]KAA1105647.1 hypothetical protein PGT21_014278 [Puccinia graminis f. sp. tritici]